MLEADNICVIRNFLQDNIKKVLIIKSPTKTPITIALIQLLKHEKLAPILIDLSQSQTFTDVIADSSIDKTNVIIFDHSKLDNHYINHRLDQWQAKVIIICDSEYLHPTLDASIYFAPVKGHQPQKKLLSQLNLAPKQFTPLTLTLPTEMTTKEYQSTTTFSPNDHYLNQQLFSHDSDMIHRLADRIIIDKNFEKFLMSLVYASKNIKMRNAASNAMTALNAANVTFSDLCLSGLNLPSANLSQGIFDGTDFTDTDLTAANLQGAWLRGVNFTRTMMANLKFNERPYFKFPHQVIKSQFSTNKQLLSIVKSDDNGEIDCYVNDSKTPLHINLGETYLEESFIDFSPDGNICATVNKDNDAISLWEISTGLCLTTLTQSNKENFSAIAFGTANNVAIGLNDGTITIVDLITNNILRNTRLINKLSFITFHPLLHNYIISLHEDSYFGLNLWRINEQHQIIEHVGSYITQNSLPIDDREFPGLSFKESSSIVQSRNGKFVIELSDYPKLWHTLERSFIRCITSHDSLRAYSAAFTSDSQYMAIGFRSQTSIFNVENGNCIFTIGYVGGLLFNIYDDTLMVNTKDGVLRFCDIQELTKLQANNPNYFAAQHAVISSNGSLMAVISLGTLSLWLVEKWLCLKNLEIDKKSLTSVAFSPNGKFLAVSGEFSSTIYVLDVDAFLKSGETKLRRYHGFFHSQAKSAESIIGLNQYRYPFTRTMDILEPIAIGKNMTALEYLKYIQSLVSSKYPNTNLSTGYNIKSIALSDNYLAGTNDDGSTHLWQLTEQDENWPIGCTSNNCTNVRHRPNLAGNALISITKTVTFTNKVIYNAFNDTFIYAITYDNSFRALYYIVIIDPVHGTITELYREEVTRKSPVAALDYKYRIVDIALSPDGNYLAAAFNQSIKIFDTRSFGVNTFTPSEISDIQCLSFSPKNKYLAIACKNNTLYLYYFSQRKCVYLLSELSLDIDNINWGENTDGLFFITRSNDNVVRYWRLVETNSTVYTTLVKSTDQRSLTVGFTHIDDAKSLDYDNKELFLQKGAGNYQNLGKQCLNFNDKNSKALQNLQQHTFFKDLRPYQPSVSTPIALHPSAWNSDLDHSILVALRQHSFDALIKYNEGNQAFITGDFVQAIEYYNEGIAILMSMESNDDNHNVTPGPYIFYLQLAYSYWLQTATSPMNNSLKMVEDNFNIALQKIACLKLYVIYGLYLSQNNRMHLAVDITEKAVLTILKYDDSSIIFRKAEEIILPDELKLLRNKQGLIKFIALEMTFYLLIKACISLNEHAKAENYLNSFKQIVSRNPNDISCCILGFAYKAAQKYRDAYDSFAQAYQLPIAVEGNLIETNMEECELMIALHASKQSP